MLRHCERYFRSEAIY